MTQRNCRVIGSTHIDLGWKKGPAEMAELFEVFVVRLLDLLERHPSLTYVIEQASHLRALERSRPDLVERLGRHVAAGRLEVVGGMASTMETNLPNGECFVRNQLLGLRWFRERLGARPCAGWLIDTFGINPQVPQLLRQLGMSFLFANRFGGAVDVTAFRARGLDGTEMPVVGRDVYAPYVKPGLLEFRYVQTWTEIDALFEEADRSRGEGLLLVMPYTENEVPPSVRLVEHVTRRVSEGEGRDWAFAVPSQLARQIEEASHGWPVRAGDLNPEFTGTYSQRIVIRLQNRATEARLLETERWLSLLGDTGAKDAFEECWWKMAFVHFHDVFTGSHPTSVRDHVLRTLDEVKRTASKHLDRVLEPVCRTEARADAYSLFVFNGLPWRRREVVVHPLPAEVGTVARVSLGGRPVPFAQEGGTLALLTDLPPAGSTVFSIEGEPARGASAPVAAAEAGIACRSARIENDHLFLEADTECGVGRIALKDEADGFDAIGECQLVVQRDEGSFQIERPEGSEIAATSGTLHLARLPDSAVGQGLVLSGEFPPLPWSPGSDLRWEAEFRIAPSSARIDLLLKVRWRGERSRIRLKVGTAVRSSAGIYEVPFGTVRRTPYRDRGTARGEWPAQRFVALEDGLHGVALVNRGAAGIETNGGSFWCTLLRAPACEYAGMVPDDTSSQHGEHEFRFSLVPYRGAWHDAAIHRIAAEANAPAICRLRHGSPASASIGPLLELEAATIMLSAVKWADDGSGDLVLRLYETAGFPDKARLAIAGARQAWQSTLEETPGPALACGDGSIVVDLGPFEIRTVRVRRSKTPGSSTAR
jgi:alpha-mannosidase